MSVLLDMTRSSIDLHSILHMLTTVIFIKKKYSDFKKTDQNYFLVKRM